MPPEPFPWERREFWKHERSGSDPRLAGGFRGAGPRRWRDQHHPLVPPSPQPLPSHPYYQQNHQQRWYADFRSRPLPSGHGKQGDWHMYPEESGHGFLPFGSRFNDSSLDERNSRPFGSRGDGRYFRNSRENRGSISQKDSRSRSSEPAIFFSGPGRPNNGGKNQKSAENIPTYCSSDNSSHPCPNDMNSLDQNPSLMKEQRNVNGGNVDTSVRMFEKVKKENTLLPIDWKPLKWTRSGSLSSRGPGFSHLSSFKSMGAGSNETVAEVQPKNMRSVKSSSGGAAICVVSSDPALSEETSSRKKPRLGWGEGLTKYEKKKVEGPEDGATKNGLVICANDGEVVRSHSVALADKSPGVACLPDCASPASPSSVACSSSPGIEEKQVIKTASVDHDAIYLNCSPDFLSQTHCDGPIFNLENLEPASIANLSSLINELSQFGDQSSAGTGIVETTTMNKLLVWKVGILKALEKTESEIDILETELKSLISVPGTSFLHPATPSSQPEECHFGPCGDQVAASNLILRLDSLPFVSSGGGVVKYAPIALEAKHTELKDKDIDSPDSATSKYVEVPSSMEDIQVEDFPYSDVNNSTNVKVNGLENEFNNEKNAGHVDDTELIMSSKCRSFDLCCDIEDMYNLILSSNKDSANRASEVLNMLLPTNQCKFDVSTSASVSSLQSDPVEVKKNFLKRKRFQQFKEKVITLKYKVLEHAWKEDLLVCTRNVCQKSHKKLSASQSHSSSQSQSSSPAKNLALVPTQEVIDFARGLLSDSQVKIYRSTLKMPALILDKEKMASRFISNNGLVEDPCAVEKERSMINLWTSEERKIFIDKLDFFGKDFRKIASFLDHKTTADCVEFYYRTYKSECFEKATKKPNFLKERKPQSNSTYLVASGKRWNREANAASVYTLGSASAIAANVDYNLEIQQKCTSRFYFGTSSAHKEPRDRDSSLQISSSLDIYQNERERLAADVLAGICGSISSEAMSSGVSSSVELGESYQDRRCRKVDSSTKRSFISEVMQNVDECSYESCGEMDPSDWTDDEKSCFIQAVSSYGKDFTMVSQCVRSRSRDQCKVFFSKAWKCLGLDLIQPGHGIAVPYDVNGGGSDTEDACVVETASVNDSERLGCKMKGDDLPSPDMNSTRESNTMGTLSLMPDLDKYDDNNRISTVDSLTAEPFLVTSETSDCQVDDIPDLDFDANADRPNGANNGCAPVRDHGTVVVSLDVELTPVVEMADDHGEFNGLSEDKNMGNVLDWHCSAGNNRDDLPLKESLDDRITENECGNPKEVSGLSCSPELRMADGSASHISADPHPSTQSDILSASEKKAGMENCSAENPHVNSSQQKDHTISVKSSPQFSAPTQHQKAFNHNFSSAIGANETNDKLCWIQTDERQKNILGQSLSDNVESSHILRGYPVSVSTLKEINGDVNCKRPFSLQYVTKADGNTPLDQRSDFSLRKGNGSRHQSTVAGVPFPFKEQTTDHSRTHSGCSVNVEKSCRNGDVKLFGQILTLSDTDSKQKSCMQRADDDDIQNHIEGTQSLNLKFCGDQRFNLGSAQAKFDRSNYLGSENIPVTNFSFWDGNRGQTGFPQSDSAFLLAKYPAAFDNYVMSSAKLEQLPLHGVVQSTECSLNSASAIPTRELSSKSVMADYQLLRSRQVQPFTIDIKQPQDVLFSEMQIRNGIDVVSGMQKQARGLVGANVAGRTGALVGEQGTGVSDPVAAIKMHYAKVEQLTVQAGNVIREDNLWRNKGDFSK